MQNTPKLLIKFSSPTEHALQNLRDGVLFCQHYAAYNDPFECWTKIVEGIPSQVRDSERFISAVKAWGFDVKTETEARADPLIVSYADEYFDECQHYAPPFETMRQGMRIACFGSELDSLLMWSHYGDGLRGFCIAFDEELIAKDAPESHLLDVAYLESPPAADSFIYGISLDQVWYCRVAIEEAESEARFKSTTDILADIPMYEECIARNIERMRDILSHVFAAKPAKWEYERERRLLVQTGKTDNAPLLLSYPREAIKEVVIGERMSSAYRERILSTLNMYYTGVPMKTARRVQDAYALIID